MYRLITMRVDGSGAEEEARIRTGSAWGLAGSILAELHADVLVEDDGTEVDKKAEHVAEMNRKYPVDGARELLKKLYRPGPA
jgi:hypothetical protein